MADQKNNLLAQLNINEAFAHLQKLHDELPAMEERSAQLSRAKWASEITKLEHSFSIAQTLLDEAQEHERCVREEFESAKNAGEEVRSEELRRAVLHAGALTGYRVGPAQNARKQLDDALSGSPFDSAEEAKSCLMDEQDINTLESSIEKYRNSFARMRSYCEKINKDTELSV